MVSLGKVLYAAATILPGTQQIVGLGKIGYGIYKLCTAPKKIETGSVNKLFAKQNHKKEGWTHIKQGALLFIPIIGTIYAIYKLIISRKGPEKNSEVKTTETTPTNEVKKEPPKKIASKKPSLLDNVIPLHLQPLTKDNLADKFFIFALGCKGKKNPEKFKLSAAFALEIKNANLIEEFKTIEVDVKNLLAKTLKKRILEVDLLKLNKN